MRLKLVDLITTADIKLGDFKIHCATGKTPPPLEAFFAGSFKEWQEHQNQRNFQCEQVLSLIGLEGDKWLFAGIYAVRGFTTRHTEGKNWYLYSTEELGGLEHLTGRVIVQFGKMFRASYLRGEKNINQLFVYEIRSQRMTIGDFPGYDSVSISFHMLQTLIRENNPSWKTALGNVSGIYVIADCSDGKLYVGSAYGGKGIWQRWFAYAKNGHGGNEEIRDLIRQKGVEHASNFQFSILEVCDLKANDDYVILRENHWKNALFTREYGLNKN